MNSRKALAAVVAVVAVASVAGCSKPAPETPKVNPNVPIGPGNLPPPPGGTQVTPPSGVTPPKAQ